MTIFKELTVKTSIFFVCYLNEYWRTIDWYLVILYEESLSIISVSCRTKWSIWIHQDLFFCFLINVVKHEFSLYIQCLVCSSNSVTTTFTGWLWILVMISVGDEFPYFISLVSLQSCWFHFHLLVSFYDLLFQMNCIWMQLSAFDCNCGSEYFKKKNQGLKAIPTHSVFIFPILPQKSRHCLATFP